MTNEEELAKIIYFSREIETILKDKFKAEGKGLHTYIDSIENKIEIQLVKDLRYIATIRNKSMHESSFKINNFSRYKRVAEQSIYRLNNLTINKKVNQSAYRRRNNRDNRSKSRNLLKNIVLLTLITIMLFIYVSNNNIKSTFNNKFSEVKEYINDSMESKEKLSYTKYQNTDNIIEIKNVEIKELIKIEKEIELDKIESQNKTEKRNILIITDK